MTAHPTRTIVDCFFGDTLEILVGGEAIPFEFSEFFGPMPVTKRGAEKHLGPKHLFWRAVSLWKFQGSRMAGKVAVWHEPKAPVFSHLGGKNYAIIEYGDDAWWWLK